MILLNHSAKAKGVERKNDSLLTIEYLKNENKAEITLERKSL